ncbi:ankyrin repeat and MYND domain-containing protein 1 isoform X4 [Pseudochaenichthys georgianus]|uniref:ankyrin repeat and MYND domain-containing protein 1 isoform X4 n=1 Tax=Pseudochaenichthys georgianus TaxID=52239 RepID=UPI00146CCAB1|nr:ankyrin repeat and MYND domain-containing protein 1 isoform X4 [Pseudochaenichthys georgianus]
MLSTCKGVAAVPERGVVEPGESKQSDCLRGAQSGEERRQGLGVQEWPDGSRFEGEFVNGFKHGNGKYTWRNGEFYEGSFYKDYRHGDGVYCWPTGHRFTGKFYLNRKEGYGQQQFPDGASFQGLYHADQRFGPGVVTYPDGRKDVGLWLGERLLRLCTSVKEGFSLEKFPEYAADMDSPAIADSMTQRPPSPQKEATMDSKVDRERDLQSDENFILPPGMESYSTDGDHLPLPPGRRRELDQHFYGELWEPDSYPHHGYERDPLSSLPLQARMQAHIHKHRSDINQRLQAENVDWDVAAVLSLNRDSSGPKGPLEVSSELLIQHSSRGDLQAVSQVLQTGLVHPDVADSQGHTALIAATVNCHNDVIQLLLDMGADIDKINCEGMSALAVCHVLYYPFHSLHNTLVEPPAKTQVSRSASACGSSPQISQVDFLTDTPRTEELTEHILHHSSNVSNSSELITERWPGLDEPETDTEHLKEERKEKDGEEREGREREREEMSRREDENESKGEEREDTEREGREREREEMSRREDENESKGEEREDTEREGREREREEMSRREDENERKGEEREDTEREGREREREEMSRREDENESKGEEREDTEREGREREREEMSRREDENESKGEEREDTEREGMEREREGMEREREEMSRREDENESKGEEREDTEREGREREREEISCREDENESKGEEREDTEREGREREREEMNRREDENESKGEEREGREREREEMNRREDENERKGEEREIESRCGQTWEIEESELEGKEREFKKRDVGLVESRETEAGDENIEEDLEEEVRSNHEEDIKEEGERGSEDVAGVERSIQVMDGGVALGSVQWTEHRAGRVQQVKDREVTPTFDSACSVSSFRIQVTEEAMQHSAEALSRTGVPQSSDTQETVRKMAAMKTEHRVRLNILKLLLERGADPNTSRVPMPVLFLAIMASDTEAVRRLLLCGARTDIPLPPKKKGLYPLHVAAALPGPAGPIITELLLHAITDPDAQACDQSEIYEPDKIFQKGKEALSSSEGPHLKEGGRTALHVACQRDADYRNASKVVALLLSHRASTDLLWSGHSPLSLAVASGNDLLEMLAQAGADILMPVMVGDVVGTAVDFAHYSFNQDSHIANTPFHTLSMRERETFKARRQLLSMMGDLLRQTAAQREIEQHHTTNITSSTERFVHTGAGPSNRPLPSCESIPPTTVTHRNPAFNFCYHCGRSVSVKLTACSRCHNVFYCSRNCKLKAWDERHKEECIRVSASANGFQKSVVLKSPRGPRPLTAMLKSKTVPRPLSLKLKSHRVSKPLGMAEKVLETQVNLNENYSCN